MKLTNRGSLILASMVTVAAVGAALVAAGSAGHGDASKLVNGGASAIQLRSASAGVAIPELGAATAWDNSPAMTSADLKGKVVLVDFWDASCINCRRTFPFLRQLYDTYKAKGLVVVGVHTPEFDFEKAHPYVARTARELGVTWPVAEDPEREIWNAFGNQYWPAQYFVDRSGNFRGAHIGEGDDASIETAVRTLLDEGGNAGSATIADASPAPAAQGVGLTPELYMGSDRGGDVPAGTLTYKGSFDVHPEFRTAAAGASVGLNFFAKEVFAVLAPPAGAPVSLRVTLDGKPVAASRRGSDLSVASNGDTILRVDKQDLFHLITGSAAVNGKVVLTAVTSGAEFFTFTFGS